MAKKTKATELNETDLDQVTGASTMGDEPAMVQGARPGEKGIMYEYSTGGFGITAKGPRAKAGPKGLSMPETGNDTITRK